MSNTCRSCSLRGNTPAKNYKPLLVRLIDSDFYPYTDFLMQSFSGKFFIGVSRFPSLSPVLQLAGHVGRNGPINQSQRSPSPFKPITPPLKRSSQQPSARICTSQGMHSNVSKLLLSNKQIALESNTCTPEGRLYRNIGHDCKQLGLCGLFLLIDGRCR